MIEKGHIVWSKNSCGFTLVVFEEAPKPFATPNRAFMCRVLAGRQEPPLLHREVPRYLHHPRRVGMRCHPRNMHLPAPQMDEKEDVIHHQPAQRPDLGGEKVRRDQHIHVRTDKSSTWKI